MLGFGAETGIAYGIFDVSTSRPCERRDPYGAESRFGTGAEAFFTFEARGDGSLRSQGRPVESLCKQRLRSKSFDTLIDGESILLQAFATTYLKPRRLRDRGQRRRFQRRYAVGADQIGLSLIHISEPTRQ